MSRLSVFKLKREKIKAISTYNSLSSVSDLALLASIGNNSAGNELDSESAFNEFFLRYKNFLLRACKKSCASFDSSEMLADDIFQNTLLKVLNKANTFKSKSEEGDSKNISIEIKAWLSRIAYHELINFLRKNPDEKALSNPFREKSLDFAGAQDDSSEEEKENIKPEKLFQKNILDTALASLTEREKYILMAYMQYFEASQPLKHLPDEVMQSICMKFDLKPDNVRQIKGRAMKKLKLKMDSLSK